jgi:hypothetical protein
MDQERIFYLKPFYIIMDPEERQAVFVCTKCLNVFKGPPGQLEIQCQKCGRRSSRVADPAPLRDSILAYLAVVLVLIGIAVTLLLVMIVQVVAGLYNNDPVVFSYLEFGMTMGSIAMFCGALAAYPFFRRKSTEYMLAWGHKWSEFGRKPPGFIPPPIMDR